MVALTNFANITLSSLYFDITKDVLYASDVHSMERRVVVDTLRRVSMIITEPMNGVSHPSLDIANNDLSTGPCASLPRGRNICTSWNWSLWTLLLYEQVGIISTSLHCM